MKRNKGFTLIELLVVIAIIGILSSVVLASLSNARAKGKDASVKSQMSSLRAQGELYYSEHDSYGEAVTSVCNIGSDANGFYNLLLSTKDVSGVSIPAELNATGIFGSPTDPLRFSSAMGTFNKVTCHTLVNSTDNTSFWAAEAPLSNSTDPLTGGAASMYCVDSTGVSRVVTQYLTDSAGAHYVTCQPN